MCSSISSTDKALTSLPSYPFLGCVCPSVIHKEHWAKVRRLIEPTSATIDLLPYKIESNWRTGVVVPPLCSCSCLITVLVTLYCAGLSAHLTPRVQRKEGSVQLSHGYLHNQHVPNIHNIPIAVNKQLAICWLSENRINCLCCVRFFLSSFLSSNVLPEFKISNMLPP